MMGHLGQGREATGGVVLAPASQYKKWMELSELPRRPGTLKLHEAMATGTPLRNGSLKVLSQDPETLTTRAV